MKGEMHTVIVRVNRKFKDSLFRVIFSEKKELLELYNAINGSHYENPGDRCPFRFRSSSYFTTGPWNSRTAHSCGCPICSTRPKAFPVWSAPPP